MAELVRIAPPPQRILFIGKTRVAASEWRPGCLDKISLKQKERFTSLFLLLISNSFFNLRLQYLAVAPLLCEHLLRLSLALSQAAPLLFLSFLLSAPLLPPALFLLAHL